MKRNPYIKNVNKNISFSYIVVSVLGLLYLKKWKMITWKYYTFFCSVLSSLWNEAIYANRSWKSIFNSHNIESKSQKIISECQIPHKEVLF